MTASEERCVSCGDPRSEHGEDDGESWPQCSSQHATGRIGLFPGATAWTEPGDGEAVEEVFDCDCPGFIPPKEAEP